MKDRIFELCEKFIGQDVPGFTSSKVDIVEEGKIPRESIVLEFDYRDRKYYLDVRKIGDRVNLKAIAFPHPMEDYELETHLRLILSLNNLL